MSNSDIKTSGVILRLVDFKESDRIFDLLNEDGEIVSFFARSARKPKSKFHGIISIGNFVNINYTKGKNLNYPTEITYDLERIFDFYKKSLDSMYFYTDILSIIRIIAKDYSSPELFQLLIEVLEKAQKSPLSHENFLLLYNEFLQNVLSLLGIEAELKCYISGEEINEPEFYYHLESNKVFSLDKKPRTLDLPLVKFDQFFQKNYLQRLFYGSVNTKIRLKF